MQFLKYSNPVTSSQRHLIRLNNKILNKKALLKNSIVGFKKRNAGRNNTGRIVLRFRGQGNKKRYRDINFLRNKKSTGLVTSLEYDPNRNCNIISIYDLYEKRFFYYTAPNNINKGDIVKTGVDMEPRTGYSMPLSAIPVGSLIHNISLKKLKPAQLTRAAGTFSKITDKTFENVTIKLSSGATKIVSSKCYATVGTVSNEFFFLTNLGKAGRSRWLGHRPTVRGVAMNPVDHPHGGGEGRTSGKGKNYWGKTIKLGKK